MGNGEAAAPNITPHKTGLNGWSIDEIVTALKHGITPSYEVLGGPMSEVVRYRTSKMTERDLLAIATYLKALPPLESTERKP